MLTPNQLLQQGRYQIIKQLGQNGNGTGYEAFDKVLNTNVLLKEFQDKSSLTANPADLELQKLAFAKEAKMLKELKHESLLQVHDHFSEADRHYMTAENADASYLGELLEKKRTPFDLTNTAAWIEQLLDAVNYLHQQTPPLIHREIRPQNIKLTSGGKIKLLTFGITQSPEKRAGATAQNQSFDAAALPYTPLEQIWEGLDTASKKVILNDYDEASEKILEQPADARSDIYAIGATFYHLLTAKLPVDALTRSIDLLEGKVDPLPAPSELNPSIPTEVSDLILQALEIRREHRFTSAANMRQVLRTAFVRIKERESSDPKKENDVLEIPVPEPKQPVRQPVKQENVQIEDEQKRQLELIKQQLREAEERRLEAERRATEAEKLLKEKEAKIQQVKAEAAKPAPAATTPSESEDFDGMFSQPENENGSMKKMIAAAGGLVVLVGAIWGVWAFVLSKPEAKPAIQPTAVVTTPAPNPETTPAPNPETATVPSTETTSGTTQNTSPEVSDSAPGGSRTKPAAAVQPTVAPVKKPNIATTKTPANEKKPVTLDELLKDN